MPWLRKKLNKTKNIVLKHRSCLKLKYGKIGEPWNPNGSSDNLA